MADAFVTLVSIQPSGAVQVETDREKKLHGSRGVSQGIFSEIRKQNVKTTNTTK